MAARRSTSLLLLVALLAATYFSCASAFNLVRPEGLHGRKFLSPTTKKIEAGRRHNSFLKMAPAHHQVKTDHVRAGFNKGGAVLQPTATDSYYSRIVDHTARTHKIHAGSKREGVTEIHPAVSSLVKKVSTGKSIKSEWGTEHTYSQAKSKSTDNVRTGFNRGGAVLHPSPQDTYHSRALEARVKAKSTENVYTGFNRGGVLVHSAPKDTYYSRAVAARVKAKSTDNVHTGLNGRSVTLHPVPKKVFTDNQTKPGEPRTYSRTVAANQAKTHNVYTGFNQGRAVLH